jgi:hypothetical protein
MGFGKKFRIKLILSKHCNIVGHFEILEQGVGKIGIVRGC